ncbi:protein FRA10AC1 homolog isoform X6 [Bacillus rossius redtenbacheri]|uniref:protein FRA10AC1 homolog isoform X6 n=1 Tax=Bacillus rossius redtenbacheri TaxID=93214 RepID=UPI002FDE49D7
MLRRSWAASGGVDPALAALSTYDLHKRLINDYLLTGRGATQALRRDTSRDKHDIDVIREHHRFLWDEGTTTDSWEVRLAKKYYDKLFKEYCICDLSRYKENKVGMRWRTQQEVVVGKGQFSCGEKRCSERDGLRSWEVNFGYVEHGTKKNALVKVRLCAACSERLNHRQQRREVTRRAAKEPRASVEEGPPSQGGSDSREAEGGEGGGDAGDGQEGQGDEVWRGAGPEAEERSREDEFQDYLEQLLM